MFILRVLENGGFVHGKTQADVNRIRFTPRTAAEKRVFKAELKRLVAWVKANVHHGFRTGALLVNLSEAGMNMTSFDRTDSGIED